MRKTVLFFYLLSNLVTGPLFAETRALRAFEKGSYQTLLNRHQDKPVMLVLWSITCSSCLKEMKSLKAINDGYPEIDVVTISVDDFSNAEQVNKILENNQLNQLDNWLFKESNSAKLRYQIDPGWYGELPRTYFFNAAHDRTGVSGVLSEEDYRQLIGKILP